MSMLECLPLEQGFQTGSALQTETERLDLETEGFHWRVRAGTSVLSVGILVGTS